jgi:hypothetical protein
MSTIKVNTVTKRTGSTLTLGESGTAVTLACGATQTGFGRTGTVDWCTTAKTSPFTAVSGDGFFVNTTSGGITVTLPSSPSAGDIVSFADYANTWQTSNVTICRNGSNINGGAFNALLNTEGQSVTLVYVDGTRGWKNVQDSTSDVSGVPSFICATGGTITTCGNDKIHTFTGDGTFTINTAPTPANNNVSYMVIAGGGGGGGSRAGGGGAGGFREGKTPATPYTASPLNAPAGLPVSVQAYPITVGGGGGGGACSVKGTSGASSVFSTITSAGGGGGGANGPSPNGQAFDGGSGGGSMEPAPGATNTGGVGNTPPVSPPQGNPGGAGVFGNPHYGAGAGGGATAAGSDGTTSIGGTGGAGATTNISGSPVGRAGGGGGGGNSGTSGPASDGGGAGGSPAVTTGAGTANTGGGGGGGNGTAPNPANPTPAGAAGGSGVVIIRYKFQ